MFWNNRSHVTTYPPGFLTLGASLPSIWHLLSKCQIFVEDFLNSMLKIFSIFVAFLENMNFKCKVLFQKFENIKLCWPEFSSCALY